MIHGLFYPTQRAGEKAATLQALVQDHELGSTTPINEHSLGIATIHARQDIVLLVAWQEAHHRQLVNISRGVWFFGVMILIAIGSIHDALPF
jgi:hypothetical protein